MMTLSVHPVEDADNGPGHWLVLFHESVAANEDLSESDRRNSVTHESTIQRLEDENRSLKSHLQDTLDRSAVSNEEAKASNEELQAINEELRSAKEELETSKEELQSANEELTTVNFELRMKIDEAGRHNDDLRNLMEASDIATVFVDSALRVRRFTPRASRLFALIPTDVGRPLMDVKSRLLYNELVEDTTAVFKNLQPIERSVSSIDQGHFLARVQPYRIGQDKIGGAVLTFVDVTELRRAEDRVRQTEQRLRDAIASSKDFAVISIDSSGRVTTWNEGAATIFGYKHEEMIGVPIDVIFTIDDRAQGVPERERHIAAREGRASDERWHQRKDGTTFYCSGVMTPIATERGTGFVKIARDVSELKLRESRQEAELSTERRTTAQVKAGAEVKDRFLAQMAHELKQPLNLIQVSAELLIRLPETRGSASAQRIGGTIMRAVAAQETIVNDLLDFSRVQTGKLRLRRTAVDLVEIVQRLSQAMAQDAARKQITLVVQADEPVICSGDSVRLEQIVWNLLGNAVKFTPEGGTIVVKVQLEQWETILEIADTGIGISPEFLPKVFELFSQDDTGETLGPRRAGLGIGLALVKELVRAHGGRIDAMSLGKGRGSTFRVSLPLAAGGLERAVSAQPLQSLHHDVLLVDDDVDSLIAFAELLRMEGATVDTAASSEEALTTLASKEYDLLLSDINMPGMSGLQLIEKARKLKTPKKFTALALTGDVDEANIRKALAAGFDGYIFKPISLERLRKSLDALKK